MESRNQLSLLSAPALRSSPRAGTRAPAGRARAFRHAAALAACSILAAASPAWSRVYLTQKEALEHAFPPGCSVERRTLFLEDEEVNAIQAKAGAKVDTKVVTYYIGKDATGRLLGHAFFETRTIRTMPATYMAVVDPDSSIRAAEILAFHEPEDYLPPERWLAQFTGKTLHDDLRVKGGIHGMSGATLSSWAFSDGIRRILAIYEVAVSKERRR